MGVAINHYLDTHKTFYLDTHKSFIRTPMINRSDKLHLSKISKHLNGIYIHSLLTKARE